MTAFTDYFWVYLFIIVKPVTFCILPSYGTMNSFGSSSLLRSVTIFNGTAL